MATSSHTANSPVSFSSKRNGSRLLERCTQTGSGACDNEGTGTAPREGSRAAVPEGQVAARPDAGRGFLKRSGASRTSGPFTRLCRPPRPRSSRDTSAHSTSQSLQEFHGRL